MEATRSPPHCPRAVHLMIRVPDPLNLDAQHIVPVNPCTPLRGIRVLGLVQKVGRRGDRQRGARSARPVDVSMVIDEPHHHVTRRSSSAWAKYADALRKSSFVGFSPRFSRSNSLNRWRSSVVSPPRWPWSRSASAMANSKMLRKLAIRHAQAHAGTEP